MDSLNLPDLPFVNPSLENPPQVQQTVKAGWEYAAVFVGGAAGSILREAITPALPSSDWVTATFAVNVVACFVLGWLYAVRHRVHAHVTHLGAVGFCGGLSTFSTLAAELYPIIVAGQYWPAFRASFLEIGIGITAALIGEMLGRRWHGAAP